MKTLAAFDFDGTLSYRDVLVPFLIFKNGRLKTFLHLVLTLPYFIAFSLGWISRGRTKEALLTRALGGVSVDEAKQWGERFAAGPLNDLLRPERMEVFQKHKSEGHLTVIVSANLELFLAPWAKLHGFDGCLATRLAEEKGKITGRLLGPNCREEEKVKRFLAWAGSHEGSHEGSREGYLLWVYGDSDGDEHLLKIADHPTKYGH